ncbi:MAG TPA: hypothetical protein VNH18_12560, partial [Bryobacteraceae bacterium]|nr:hypothetical protein [Bryobacteraceae bacterium]
GVRSSVGPGRFLRVFGGEVLATAAYPETVLWLVVLALGFPHVSRLRDYWPVLILALAPVIGYCFIVTEERYVGGALTLAIVCALRCVPADRVRRVILIALSCAMLFLVFRMNWRAFRRVPGHEQTEQARSVLKAGVGMGSRIGVIGNAELAKVIPPGSASYVGASHEIWAWINRQKIVAEVPPEQATEFDRLSAGEQGAILTAMRSAGSRAVIAVNHPNVGEVAGWKRVSAGMLTIFIPVR